MCEDVLANFSASNFVPDIALCVYVPCKVSGGNSYRKRNLKPAHDSYATCSVQFTGLNRGRLA